MDPETRNKIISSHGPLISSSMSSVYTEKKTKGNFSVEDSGPPSPTSGTVLNFGEVAPGIYRSSFPMNGNFEHLRSLGLKTILTLVPQDYPAENVLFMKENGISHFQIPIAAHKNESVTIPLENIANALDILRNPERHPVLVHCNKGKVSSYLKSLYPPLSVLALHAAGHGYRCAVLCSSRCVHSFIPLFCSIARACTSRYRRADEWQRRLGTLLLMKISTASHRLYHRYISPVVPLVSCRHDHRVPKVRQLESPPAR